jgi:CheY-like chemotaxis protein
VPTVLLLENDPVSRHIIGLILRKKGGYTVLEASTTPEAITYTRRYQIDLAIVEASTRDVYAGGQATARQLKAISPALRFLFVSGYPRDLLIKGGFLQFEDPFLARPFTPRVLLERLEQVLARPARSGSVIAKGA